jgi:hypothetical protein
MQSIGTEEERNPYLRANSLDELLAWSDADFVRCAYVTILGRQPEAHGEAFYTRRIRQGHSKLEVLWQLRRSPEGRAHDPGIAQLDRTLKRAAWGRRPLIGAIVRAVIGGEANDRLAKVHRSLLNEMSLLGRKVAGNVPSDYRAVDQVDEADATAPRRRRQAKRRREIELSPATQHAFDILTGRSA